MGKSHLTHYMSIAMAHGGPEVYVVIVWVIWWHVTFTLLSGWASFHHRQILIETATDSFVKVVPKTKNAGLYILQ